MHNNLYVTKWQLYCDWVVFLIFSITFLNSYLSNLYTQSGTQTHNPDHELYALLTQPARTVLISKI